MFALLIEHNPIIYPHYSSSVAAISPDPERLKILESSLRSEDVVLADRVHMVREAMEEWERDNPPDLKSPVDNDLISKIQAWHFSRFDFFQALVNRTFDEQERFLTRNGTCAPHRTYKIQPVSSV